MNKKMRQARLDGSTFGGRLGARFAGATGMISSSESIAREKSRIETEQRKHDDKIKSIEDNIAPTKRRIAEQKHFSDSVKAMETRAKEEIQNGRGGDIGTEYLRRKAEYERLKNSPTATAEEIAQAEASMHDYLNNEGMKKYMTAAMTGNGKFSDGSDDQTFENMRKTAVEAAKTIGVKLGISTDPKDVDKTIGDIVHSQFGASKGKTGDLERSIYNEEQAIEKEKLGKAKLGDDLRDISLREQKAKANESAIK